MKHDPQHIRRYLLGQLDAADAEPLELDYFSDAAIYEEVRAVEDDLVDAYAKGDLTGDERRALEAGLLASDRGQAQLAFVHALAARADRGADAAPGWGSRVARWLWPRPLAARLALGAALAAALVVGTLTLAGRGAAGPAGPTVAVLELSPQALRTAQDAATLRVGAGTETVELVLGLDVDETATQVALVLRQGGQVRWRSPALAVKDWRVTARVPARLLSSGRCEVELVRAAPATAAPETLAYYAFTVARD